MNKLAIVALVAWAPFAGNAQGFVNLGFEAGNLAHYGLGPALVPTTDALPGWTVEIQGFQMSWVLYNDVSLGSAAVSLHGPGSVYLPFEGSYFVLLQADYPGFTTIPSLAQVGMVPANAKSIRFYSNTSGFEVTFAGQTIPMSLLGSGDRFNVYGGDIDAFAGRIGELRLRGQGFLDNIQFSSQPIPEPGSLALFGAGVLLFARRFLARRL